MTNPAHHNITANTQTTRTRSAPAARPLSSVPQETFASQNLDLNKLRERVLGNQNTGSTRPNDPAKSIVVDRNGNMHMGDTPNQPLGPKSTIPQETFAGRSEDDIAVANEFLPPNTQHIVTDEGQTGFLYSFKSELGDDYQLFAFYDGSSYQVQVIDPEVEKRFNNPHDGHIFPATALICFGSQYGNGMPTLQDAYSKSVLWANGMSIATRTGTFPFSNNNT